MGQTVVPVGPAKSSRKSADQKPPPVRPTPSHDPSSAPSGPSAPRSVRWNLGPGGGDTPGLGGGSRPGVRGPDRQRSSEAGDGRSTLSVSDRYWSDHRSTPGNPSSSAPTPQSAGPSSSSELVDRQGPPPVAEDISTEDEVWLVSDDAINVENILKRAMASEAFKRDRTLVIPWLQVVPAGATDEDLEVIRQQLARRRSDQLLKAGFAAKLHVHAVSASFPWLNNKRVYYVTVTATDPGKSAPESRLRPSALNGKSIAVSKRVVTLAARAFQGVAMGAPMQVEVELSPTSYRLRLAELTMLLEGLGMRLNHVRITPQSSRLVAVQLRGVRVPPTIG